jgi:hypothetical protein
LWEFSYNRLTGVASWAAANISGSSVGPPAMTLMMSTYDSNRDQLYVWHGLYEDFNPNPSDVANTMWVYSWYVTAFIYWLLRNFDLFGVASATCLVTT